MQAALDIALGQSPCYEVQTIRVVLLAQAALEQPSSEAQS